MTVCCMVMVVIFRLAMCMVMLMFSMRVIMAGMMMVAKASHAYKVDRET